MAQSFKISGYNETKLAIKTGKEALDQFIQFGDEDQLEMALAIYKALGVPDGALLQMEANALKARSEFPERVKAWEALPNTERLAILQMSKD